MENDANRVGAERPLNASDRQHIRLRARHVNTDESFLGDHLAVVSIASAVIAIENADGSEAGDLCFFDRDLCAAKTAM